MLEIVSSTPPNDLARVFVGRLSDGELVEMVESVQPPVPRAQKWVLIISTLKGCPVRCAICDAGGRYRGKLTAGEIVAQVDTLIAARFRLGDVVPVRRLKVQCARVGEPALNDAVLDALETLDERPDLPGFFPSVSTIAPAGRDGFFERLLRIKRQRFGDGRFQLQFSIHTTDEAVRRRLVPVRTWSFAQIADYGGRFTENGDRKVTLNFAPARGLPLDPGAVARMFSPRHFLIKLTPINPTRAARDAGLTGLIEPCDHIACTEVAEGFRRAGFETLVSIGELEENQIGSNCGMLLSAND
ncbi:radical SAM protein [Candidatus Fermentibacteria bacterium]|nr:radical SAM protein [Candidatus Fermentibacteria bacterium]